MKIQLFGRWSSEIKYECELEARFDSQPMSICRGEAIKRALKSGSNLSGSDLRGSDLRGSNLRRSDLRGSDLSGSNLSDSDLRGSNLRRSDLRGSDLSGSDLRGSDLRGSNLRRSDLRGSDLSGSNLSDSDLRGSDLRGSDLRDIKNDFFEILLHAPKEAAGLADALRAGKVNGSTYEGECACLVGTIAKLKEVNYARIPGLSPNSSRPAERWFLGIKEGDKPATNQIVKITLEWIDQFQSLMAVAK